MAISTSARCASVSVAIVALYFGLSYLGMLDLRALGVRGQRQDEHATAVGGRHVEHGA